jgi:hypothetical protein
MVLSAWQGRQNSLSAILLHLIATPPLKKDGYAKHRPKQGEFAAAIYREAAKRLWKTKKRRGSKTPSKAFYSAWINRYRSGRIAGIGPMAAVS